MRSPPDIRRWTDSIYYRRNPRRNYTDRDATEDSRCASTPTWRKVHPIPTPGLRRVLGLEKSGLDDPAHGRERPASAEVPRSCAWVDPDWCMWQHTGACTQNLPSTPGCLWRLKHVRPHETTLPSIQGFRASEWYGAGPGHAHYPGSRAST